MILRLICHPSIFTSFKRSSTVAAILSTSFRASLDANRMEYYCKWEISAATQGHEQARTLICTETDLRCLSDRSSVWSIPRIALYSRSPFWVQVRRRAARLFVASALSAVLPSFSRFVAVRASETPQIGDIERRDEFGDVCWEQMQRNRGLGVPRCRAARGGHCARYRCWLRAVSCGREGKNMLTLARGRVLDPGADSLCKVLGRIVGRACARSRGPEARDGGHDIDERFVD